MPSEQTHPKYFGREGRLRLSGAEPPHSCLPFRQSDADPRGEELTHLRSDDAQTNVTLRSESDLKVRPRAEPATACLPYRAESVGAARRLVCAKLREWGLDELVDDAALIVSELATNAVKTGCQTRMVVAVRRPSSRVVRILVGDGSRVMPVMIRADSGSTSGRGLAMVHRLTHGRWGVSPLPLGKVVHADLPIVER